MYHSITIFGIEVYLFNICVAFAFLAAIFVFLFRTRDIFSPETQDSLVAMAGADIPFIIAGAFLHNKFFYASSLKDFFDILPENTGFAFLGGLIGGIIGFIILFPILVGKHVPMAKVMEEMVSPIIIGHAIGRVGCLLGGCCYGKPSHFGIVYKPGTPAYEAYGAVKIFPVPALESVLLLILLLIILSVKHNAVFIYFIGYSTIRFFIEFLRGDERGTFSGFLSPAQAICIVAFTVMICVRCIIWIRRQKRHALPCNINE